MTTKYIQITSIQQLVDVLADGETHEFIKSYGMLRSTVQISLSSRVDRKGQTERVFSVWEERDGSHHTYSEPRLAESLIGLSIQNGNLYEAKEIPDYVDEHGIAFNIWDKEGRYSLDKCPKDFQGEYIVPNNVEVMRVGEYAFSDCAGLTSVVIADSVAEIGWYAFTDCTSLLSVALGKNVEKIDCSAFNGCSSISSIYVDPNNPYFCSVDGVLFSKDMSEIIRYPAGRQGAYAIPETVKTIRQDAFYGCAGLTAIHLPEMITSIGVVVFQHCTSLTTIDIPRGFGGPRALGLRGCKTLKSITVETEDDKKQWEEWCARFGCNFEIIVRQQS